MTFDFDAWRERYPSMSLQELKDTYSELYELYPIQRHFDAASCKAFLDAVGPVRVLELGGWDGELASLMLAEFPSPAIKEWCNIEICEEILAHTVCHDDRYHAGFEAGSLTSDYDTLVMSHVAEHMLWRELEIILDDVRPSAVFFAMPLPTDGSDPNWHGYEGTHILEVGWTTITAWLEHEGYVELVGLRTHEVRCFVR